MKLKRLFLDLETAPLVALTWRIGYKIQISHDNIIKERAIICAGYKWAGEKKVYCPTWDRDQNDRSMLESLIPVLNQADEIVMHNGDRFDMPWVKTRCLFHRLPTFPDYKTIDTLQWAKRKFLFSSNRLDYIAKFLGMEGKIKTEFGLWKDIVLRHDDAALAKMVRYCKNDVVQLEKVYDELAAVVSHKTHAGVIEGLDNWSCPHCASTNVYGNGTRISASGTKYHRMQCKDCGRWYRINNVAHGRYLKKDELKQAA